MKRQGELQEQHQEQQKIMWTRCRKQQLQVLLLPLQMLQEQQQQ
jgi:hypothetical protein